MSDTQETVNPLNPLDVIETIAAKEHMNPSEVIDTLEKISKVSNMLVGRMLIGKAFQDIGVAHPVAQQIVQCAAAAAMAAMGLREQRRQLIAPGNFVGRA